MSETQTVTRRLLRALVPGGLRSRIWQAWNLFALVVKTLRQRLSYLYYCFLVRKPLTINEKEFIEANSEFWGQYINNTKRKRTGKYVLVEPRSHPYLLHYEASLATIINQVQGNTSLYVLESRCDQAIRSILQSYPGTAVIYLDSWRYFLPNLFAYLEAWKAYRSLNSPDDLLKFEVDGVRFGDLIYDETLTEGYATLSVIDKRVLNHLHRFFLFRHIIKDIIGRYDIEMAVVSHMVGIPVGVFVRYLLVNRVEVFSTKMVSMTCIKKCRNIEEAWDYEYKPGEKYVTFAASDCTDRIIQLVDTYLQRRFSGEIDELDAAMAYQADNRTFRNKGAFCLAYDLEPERPIVFVMLHSFNDYPHIFKRMIYRDYYDWFFNTLAIAKEVTSVNWIFKEHPAARYYTTRDLNLDDVFSNVHHRHIVYLNRDAGFNTNSLQYTADVIVTCLGTAGLEYSCIGIPCVLGGESPYSGYGFTIEPRSQQEYEIQLRGIHKLRRLHAEQIRRAKLIAAFQLLMLVGDPFPLCPEYARYEEIRYIDRDDFWQRAAHLLRNVDQRIITRQFNALSEFIQNESFTQYIDLERYPFMREAIYGEQK